MTACIKRLVVALPFFLAPFILHAQYFEKGQDPASVRWQQINTPRFQVIFPDCCSRQAQRITNLLEYVYATGSYSLNWKPSRIPVIIHNHSTESNGFVSWAPKRMELFTTPPQDIYPHEWLEQLTIHEFRHVVQVDKLNQGMTRLFSSLLGQQLPGALSSTLSMWFLEGDATLNETMLSHSGRGRLPSFEMELRTQALSGKKFFTYDESVLGSYRKYVPDYYQYGYQMIAYSQSRYGNSLWDNILSFTARNPYLINPVHFSLKKQTGLNKRKLFDATFATLRERWQQQDEAETFTPSCTLTPRKKNTYTSYRYPQVIGNGRIIALKSGIDQINEYVVIDSTGSETRIWQPGYSGSGRISAGGNIIVWDEWIPDVRWGNRSYSVVKMLDLNSRQETTVGTRSRYFAPALSNDLSTIAVVKISLQNDYSLALLDRLTGKLLMEFPVPDNAFIQYPSWSEDGKYIVAIFLDSNGKGILQLKPESGEWKYLMDASFQDISKPVIYHNHIFFQGSFSGIENIYALDTVTGQVARVTSSRFGAFDPEVNPQTHRLVYSDYTSQGFDIAEIHLDPGSWLPLNTLTDHSRGFDKDLSDQEKGPVLTENVPHTVYPTRPYRRLAHLFNLHSWMPFYFDLDAFDFSDPDIAPGVTLLSQDNLSTALTTIGYAYRNQDHYFYTHFVYKGWLPVVDLSYRYGGPPVIIKPGRIKLPEVMPLRNKEFNANIYLPLNLTMNRFKRAIIPVTDFTFSNYTFYDRESSAETHDTIFDRNIIKTQLRLYTYSLEKTSARDLAPRWGQIIDLSYSFVPFEKGSFNPSYTLKGVMFTPGLFRHHSLRLEGGIQRQNLEKPAFTRALPFPRGYPQEISEKLDILSADYAFPIAYPDIRLSSLLFIKRLQGSLFTDAALNQYRPNTGADYIRHRMLSLGGSLSIDYHLFRLPYPIHSGARVSYIPDEGRTTLEFIFNIDVYGFNINRR